ncbi:PhzF family phenazine biosynthesis protein [Prosthecobacter sp.]|uniref:PhzF family phenazine biosynthesis protein n=1 Tax=Prosthecobacter sp. TaxID=1965333 RepID=UPI003784B54F
MTPLHVVDAFTNRPFAGNPAGVCILDRPAGETWMKLVAREMNLAETAFVHRIERGWALRWFTPAVEVKLCGHATLAAAHVLWETDMLKPDEEARFHTLSGMLTCTQKGGWIEMDFPACPVVSCGAPAGLAEALGCGFTFCGSNGMDHLVEVADEKTLRQISPNFSVLLPLTQRGVIVTCRGESPGFDFISRFFAPAAGINEDPVTGSAHCALGPYWQEKLSRSDFTAHQASERGGTVKLSVRGDRVMLRGQAVMMSRVELFH